MENKQTGLFVNAFPWGALLAAILIAFSLILFFLDQTFASWKDFVSYVFIIAILVIATKKYRDNILGGNISYGKALAFGVILSLVTAVIMSVYNYIFVSYIETDFIEKTMAVLEHSLLDGGMPDEQIDAIMEVQRKFITPFSIASMIIPSLTFTGFIFSLITSLFIKKDNPSTTF